MGEKYSCVSRWGHLVNFDTQRRQKYGVKTIERVRDLVRWGLSTREIAGNMGIPHSSAYNIIRRECMLPLVDQSKPSLAYLSRAEYRAYYDMKDWHFDYIRSCHKDYTTKKGGKVFVNVSYFSRK